VVDKENNAFDVVSFCVGDEVAEMTTKLDVSSSWKRVPYDAFLRPDKCDEAVYSFGVSKRLDKPRFSSTRPASFDFGEEFSPLLVLEPDEDVFFISAGAMRL
jgi:hypothetical protein